MNWTKLAFLSIAVTIVFLVLMIVCVAYYVNYSKKIESEKSEEKKRILVGKRVNFIPGIIFGAIVSFTMAFFTISELIGEGS